MKVKSNDTTERSRMDQSIRDDKPLRGDRSLRETEFFTTTELAQKLKMNVQVITRKVKAGEILAYKIGKDWRIPDQSVTEWLERQTNQTCIVTCHVTGNIYNSTKNDWRYYFIRSTSLSSCSSC